MMMSARELNPAVERALGCQLPFDRRFSELWDRGCLADVLARAETRWRTGDRHVLATLWWYNASNTLVAVAFSHQIAEGALLVPSPTDPIALRCDDGYLVGWHPGARCDEAAGLARLTGAISPIIETLAGLAGRRPPPYWAVAGDALPMAAATVAVQLPPAQRPAVWRQVRVLHEHWQHFAPIPALRLVEAELAADAPAMRVPVGTLPPPRPYRRVSCCLLRRSAERRFCQDCPRRP